VSRLAPELVDAMAKVFPREKLVLTQEPMLEAESAECAAARLQLNSKNVAFRVAKTTPTKVGQFVTLWVRRFPGAEIAPFDTSDGVDVCLVSVAEGSQRGYFVFPKAALVERGVMSVRFQGGKRALRVYPPWVKPESAQAAKTQAWQCEFFWSKEEALPESVRLIFF
jgi:hypothetical protein